MKSVLIYATLVGIIGAVASVSIANRISNPGKRLSGTSTRNGLATS